MKLSKVFILLILTLSIKTLAQELPNIVPPSPEASQMLKAIETPVSHFSGLANISIPITTIKVDNIEIPIRLDYYSKGILVDEISSRIGAGWSLNYGGVVSRQIRDKADGYGILYNDHFRDFQYSPSRRINILSATVDPETNPYDFIPDQFYFSTPSESGKFIFDYMDDQPVIQDYKDIIINHDFNSTTNASLSSGFILTDKEGNKFYYGKTKDQSRKALNYEKSNTSYIYSSNFFQQNNLNESYQPNSWQLVEIETSKGNKIEFFYEPETTYYIKKNHDKHEKQGENNFYNTPTSYFSKIESVQQQLSEIKFNQGKIKFINNLQQQREDLLGGRSLDQIELYDIKNVLIKKIKLNHFYTSANPQDQNVLPQLRMLDSESEKRLFLSEVIEFPVVSSEVEPITYKLEYTNQILPSRFSTSQDAWGYYNGEPNGHYLTFFQTNVNPINRRVSPTFSSAGMLEKITYPTKGYTTYTYENNVAFYDNRFDGNIIIHETMPEDDATPVGLSPFEYNTNFNGSYYTKIFEITDVDTGISNYETINTTFHIYNNSECITGKELTCSYKASITNVDTKKSYPLKPNLSTILLPKGKYVLNVHPLNYPYDHLDMVNGFNIILNWKKNVNSSDNLYSGGKRIKSIKQFNHDNSLVTSKEYIYPGKGNLYGLPNFLSFHYKDENGQRIYTNYGGIPGAPFSTYQSNSTGYTTVIEYFGDSNQNNGKIEYSFTDTQDNGKYWEFPQHAPTDNEWLRGKPLVTNYYKNNNGNYELQRTLEYEYYNQNSMLNMINSDPQIETLKPEPTYKGLSQNVTDPLKKYKKTRDSFRLPLFSFMSSGNVSGEPANNNIPNCWVPDGNGGVKYECSEDYYYKSYFLTGGFAPLKKITQTEYYEGSEFITVNEYLYNTQNNYQIKSTQNRNSIEETLETKYSYAHEIGNQAMIAKNMIGIPLKTETLRNNEKLSTQETLYKDWGNNLLAPEIVKVSKGNQDLEDRIKYNRIDGTNGNPLEVEQIGGTKIAYIWGYNKTQPIAKIENASYADVESYVSNLQSKSDTGTESELITALNNLRTALPNAMVTTLTYKPLVGVSTVTDPKGNLTTYLYDEFNRLKQVVDHQGNVISENNYNYRPN
ncbi:RHS repeat domain-containing protein [Flavobacterium terrae]|uniref:YD repeat-containing protein n=1 Tax=Flavobacterium terrae TaxID=415425 RepID=A0A1M6CVU6_9FLAO|nr:RHS repeat domain-containing protein [Flavobacterium terrae]SHI64858.1 hypothetical protein SAMN05444363_1112 [Flavobacterium terrae]